MGWLENWLTPQYGTGSLRLQTAGRQVAERRGGSAEPVASAIRPSAVRPARALFFLAFIVYPSVSGFAISLTAWTGMGNDFHFVGLQNFREALVSWALYRAAWHNVIMFIAILAFQHTVGLFLAVQLNARPRFMEVYRAILFLPVIISLVATGFIWTLMLSPNFGVINPLLQAIGLGFLAQSWLGDPNLALATVIVAQCWSVLGWAIIIYLVWPAEHSRGIAAGGGDGRSQ